MPAYALGRGLKTLPLRVARHNANAHGGRRVPRAGSRASARSTTRACASHPDHAIATRQMTRLRRHGLLRSRRPATSARQRVYDRLQVIKRAASLGGVESLISLPVLTSQWGHTDEQLQAAGVTKGMLRLSVGLEDAADLIADLDQALGS